ncbi:transglycosylase domain-containing protein [Albibacterium indicum]|uniref:transglycosylase domain-containing protein n=1 Tax=Albibacterium indicum TaxID=2292082 RepID=UPI001FEB02DE|nr:biosynthetic peptidoglycan transglycosylase [Pedobacter indicus]
MEKIRAFLKSIPKRYYIIAASITGALLVLFTIVAIIAVNKREPLLKSAIERAKAKALEDYQIKLDIEDAYFSGLKEVTFEDISATPLDADTLAKIELLRVSVKLFPLLSGTVKLANMDMENASITFIKKDSVTSNYDFFFREDQVDTATVVPETEKEPIHLGKLVNRVIHQVLYKIPENMDLENFDVSYKDDSLFHRVTVPRANIDNGNLESTILINSDKATWHLDGDLNPGRNKLFFRLYAEDGKVELPLLQDKYGLLVNFDTVEAELQDVKWKNSDDLQISVSGRLGNFLINHWRIASNDVIIPQAFAQAEFIIGKDFIELDKGSEVQLAKITAHPYAKLTLQPHKIYNLGVDIPEMDAQEAFDSFPTGLFESLEGIKVSGKMKYSFDLHLDSQNPDSVQLHSAIEEDGFKINSYGKTDLSKINSTFTYQPYEEDGPVRNIIVGPENPNFTPLNQISPTLRNAVLTAEDPTFFQHEGFVEKSIKASIATNFKEKAFTRGGSTISMQLVKNVFLDREKTLARKVEEMLIVWLIEHNDIVSKERMYEVYLNVIEWGKDVYGISEASRHYFLKDQSQLTVGESIFLASIVPSPKRGLSRFTSYGGLQPYLTGYFRLIGTLMANSGYIPRDSTRSYGFYSVSLRNAVLPSREPEPDSTMQDTDQDRIDLEREVDEAQRLLEQLFGKEIEDQ